MVVVVVKVGLHSETFRFCWFLAQLAELLVPGIVSWKLSVLTRVTQIITFAHRDL